MSGTEKLIKWQGNKYMLIWERDGGDPRIMMKFGAGPCGRDEPQRSRNPRHLGHRAADVEAG